MTTKYPNLSKTLKRLLFEKQMKPIDLARELDIPQPTIHRLVTGKSTRPYKSSLEPIADYFSISVDQLVGEKTLPATTNNIINTAPSIQSIPIMSWKNAGTTTTSPVNKQHVITTTHCNDQCFALIQADYSMEPLFPKSSILLFDPTRLPDDRSYVLVKVHHADTPIFRQILIDVDNQYLKPLNGDAEIYKMRVLGENDAIIACLFESRLNHGIPGHASFDIEELAE